MNRKTLLAVLVMLQPVLVHAGAVEGLLHSYRQAGAGDFTWQQGEARWKQANRHAKSGNSRSCSDCHTNDLTASGKHVKSGKKIAPMAPSVNRERLVDSAKIEKWFKRNCKWTFGRECTPKEKGDFLVYLQQL